MRVVYLGHRSAVVTAELRPALPGAEVTFVDADRLHELCVDGEAIVLMDGSHDPADIPALLEVAARRSVGMVVGSRSITGGRDGSPAVGRVGTRVANAVIRHTADLPLRDVTSSFRVFTGDAWRSIGGAEALRGGLLPSLVTSAHAVHHQRWIIAEVPVSTRPVSVGSRPHIGALLRTVVALSRRRRA
ncbi:hypothetical protein HQ325_12970 [Rhodococcus sp. BP-349]|uniref:hypothetical protein n=1 Tax=unclassified Rhodococcus (in: high G+C Gram-positive bacteria) TaxID=192944 RepID=UPI001C9B35E6|nr:MULTISPECIES: hypothetical protein [unclassified Rhodococcus (in: high G+C Gram-positive bacteria)]MBY6539587.1 hypothetical protein [Rhodococcus sp. BP-363]MBY6544085.1 hypothetical protein [Rhodococcus sp. BP-369]MBY6563315.1 hypothetical protein [Rhodococcus sp. BP-370]MBY6577607.1 hypothetical protein [Rhodococcus sp. BP-364]MBY6586908.1 hypothetical protein [Rhodococcus sp. BP-358]